MSATTTAQVVLEAAAQEFVEAAARPPQLYELSPDGARAVLDGVQRGPVELLPIHEYWVDIPCELGDVRLRLLRSADAVGTLPVILYMHGGGWVLGDAFTHDRLVRELAVGAGAAVAFVEYDRAPEARYPVAIEQGYEAARWLLREGGAPRASTRRGWRSPATRSAAA